MGYRSSIRVVKSSPARSNVQLVDHRMRSPTSDRRCIERRTSGVCFCNEEGYSEPLLASCAAPKALNILERNVSKAPYGRTGSTAAPRYIRRPQRHGWLMNANTSRDWQHIVAIKIKQTDM